MKIKYIGISRRAQVYPANIFGLSADVTFNAENGWACDVPPEDAHILLTVSPDVLESVARTRIERLQQAVPASNSQSLSEEGEDVDPITTNLLSKSRQELIDHMVNEMRKMDSIALHAYIAEDEMFKGFSSKKRSKEGLLTDIKNYLEEHVNIEG